MTRYILKYTVYFELQYILKNQFQLGKSNSERLTDQVLIPVIDWNRSWSHGFWNHRTCSKLCPKIKLLTWNLDIYRMDQLGHEWYLGVEMPKMDFWLGNSMILTWFWFESTRLTTIYSNTGNPGPGYCSLRMLGLVWIRDNCPGNPRTGILNFLFTKNLRHFWTAIRITFSVKKDWLMSRSDLSDDFRCTGGYIWTYLRV